MNGDVTSSKIASWVLPTILATILGILLALVSTHLVDGHPARVEQRFDYFKENNRLEHMELKTDLRELEIRIRELEKQ